MHIALWVGDIVGCERVIRVCDIFGEVEWIWWGEGKCLSEKWKHVFEEIRVVSNLVCPCLIGAIRDTRRLSVQHKKIE